jgi:hypothetical protein
MTYVANGGNFGLWAIRSRVQARLMRPAKGSKRALSGKLSKPLGVAFAVRNAACEIFRIPLWENVRDSNSLISAEAPHIGECRLAGLQAISGRRAARIGNRPGISGMYATAAVRGSLTGSSIAEVKAGTSSGQESQTLKPDARMTGTWTAVPYWMDLMQWAWRAIPGKFIGNGPSNEHGDAESAAKEAILPGAFALTMAGWMAVVRLNLKNAGGLGEGSRWEYTAPPETPRNAGGKILGGTTGSAGFDNGFLSERSVDTEKRFRRGGAGDIRTACGDGSDTQGDGESSPKKKCGSNGSMGLKWPCEVWSCITGPCGASAESSEINSRDNRILKGFAKKEGTRAAWADRMRFGTGARSSSPIVLAATTGGNSK